MIWQTIIPINRMVFLIRLPALERVERYGFAASTCASLHIFKQSSPATSVWQSLMRASVFSSVTAQLVEERDPGNRRANTSVRLPREYSCPGCKGRENWGENFEFSSGEFA
eukprot:555533-Prorocentrum_minimum.AAC.1